MTESSGRVTEQTTSLHLRAMDVASIQLDAKRLGNSLKTVVTNSNKDIEKEIINSTLELIKAASSPAILGDVLSIRHGGKKSVEKLMNLTEFPTYSTPLVKALLMKRAHISTVFTMEKVI